MPRWGKKQTRAVPRKCRSRSLFGLCALLAALLGGGAAARARRGRHWLALVGRPCPELSLDVLPDVLLQSLKGKQVTDTNPLSCVPKTGTSKDHASVTVPRMCFPLVCLAFHPAHTSKADANESQKSVCRSTDVLRRGRNRRSTF